MAETEKSDPRPMCKCGESRSNEYIYRAGEVVARRIVLACPGLDYNSVAEVAASELFYAAQDTAWAFEMGVKVERS